MGAVHCNQFGGSLFLQTMGAVHFQIIFLLQHIAMLEFNTVRHFNLKVKIMSVSVWLNTIDVWS